MPNAAAFDSSAVLAVIYQERGTEAIIDLLRGGLLSTLSLTEMQTKLILDGASAEFAWNRILSMGCEICHYDEEQAGLAAEMIWTTRPFGLSLGDRACLALAIQRKAKVYTADKNWQRLSLGIEIEVIR